MGTRDLARGEEAWRKLGSPSNVAPIALDITQDTSIDQAFATIQSTHGRLDILIHDAGIAGRDLGVDTSSGALPETCSLREVYEYAYRVIPSQRRCSWTEWSPSSNGLPCQRSSSSVHPGFHGPPRQWRDLFRPLLWYSASRAAMNHLCVTRMYPRWKVNVLCPGHVATGLDIIQRTDVMDPAHGAANVYWLVMEGEDGCTGTFSNKEKQIPW